MKKLVRRHELIEYQNRMRHLEQIQGQGGTKVTKSDSNLVISSLPGGGGGPSGNTITFIFCDVDADPPQLRTARVFGEIVDL
jgi:hypothetical protein